MNSTMTYITLPPPPENFNSSYNSSNEINSGITEMLPAMVFPFGEIFQYFMLITFNLSYNIDQCWMYFNRLAMYS